MKSISITSVAADDNFTVAVRNLAQAGRTRRAATTDEILRNQFERVRAYFPSSNRQGDIAHCEPGLIHFDSNCVYAG